MIVGFGIDAVAISRIRRWIEDEGLLARFFHPQELRALPRKKRMEKRSVQD